MTGLLPPGLGARAQHAGVHDLLRLVAMARPAAPEPGGLGPAADEAVRLRPTLSLAFPTADVAAVAEADGRLRIDLAVAGLYGPSSPLPTYLTEALIDSGRSGHAEAVARVRGFLDVFNHRLLSLLARALAKHRPLSPAMARVRAAAMGVTGPAQDDRLPMLAAAFVRRPVSAAMLEQAMAAWLPGIPVRVETNLPTWTDLPPTARARLGAPLGGALGTRMRTCATGLRIHLGPVDAPTLRDLLPGGDGHARASQVMRACDRGLLDARLLIAVAPDALAPARLGAGASLGRDARLAGRDHGHRIELRLPTSG